MAAPGLIHSRALKRLIALVVFHALMVVYASVVRPWHMRWGATDAERAMRLPGDALMAPGAVSSTRALTVRATPEELWPWLVQLGQGRGGWYSHHWLENLFAADMRNVDRIEPALQGLKVGDPVLFTQQGFKTTVALLEPARALVLEGGWSFVLERQGPASTRLIVRYPWKVSGLANALYYYSVFEPAHFVMESGMMLGLQRQAEAGGRR